MANIIIHPDMARLRAVYSRLDDSELEGARRLIREHPAWGFEYLEDRLGIVRTRARAMTTIPSARSGRQEIFRRADGALVTLVGTPTERAAMRSNIDADHPMGATRFAAGDPRDRVRCAVAAAVPPR
jgi:hypothetical protein